MFKYTARVLLREGDFFGAKDDEDKGIVAKEATITVQARDLASAMAIIANATAMDSSDDMNFQIIKIEQV